MVRAPGKSDITERGKIDESELVHKKSDYSVLSSIVQ
jgi:hypothetical protein